MIDIDLSRLSQEELKILAARAIRLVQNPKGGIGTELFEALLGIVPQACVEAMVVDNTDRPQRIYLTWRKDQNYRGWHCPGTFILLGEDFPAALRRCLRSEIGVTAFAHCSTDVQYSLVDSLGHTIGTVWLVEPFVTTLIGNGEWFPIAQLPDPTLPHHVEFIQRVLESKR